MSERNECEACGTEENEVSWLTGEVERLKAARDSAAEADTDRLEAERDERGSALAEIETAISEAYDHDCPETDPVEMVRYVLRQLDAADQERADWKRIVDQNLDASAETVAEMERDLAAAQNNNETLRAAITRALAGCPFCKMGQCRADAHLWLAAALAAPQDAQ